MSAESVLRTKVPSARNRLASPAGPPEPRGRGRRHGSGHDVRLIEPGGRLSPRGQGCAPRLRWFHAGRGHVCLQNGDLSTDDGSRSTGA